MKIQEVLLKGNPVPLYYQLYLSLKTQIENGSFDVGDKLPSEMELRKHYNASRVTVRQALKMLKDEGMIQTRRGVGSFVNKIPEPLIHNFSLPINYQDNFNKMFERIIIKCVLVPGDKTIASLLEIDPSTDLVFLERFFVKDGKRIAYNCSWLDSKKYSGLINEKFIDNRLSVTLAKKYQVKYSRAKNIVNAILLNDDLLNVFDIDYLTPGIVVKSLSLSVDNVPIDYSQTVWLSSSVKFSIDI